MIWKQIHYRSRSTAKQGDNALDGVSPFVCLFACLLVSTLSPSSLKPDDPYQSGEFASVSVINDLCGCG